MIRDQSNTWNTQSEYPSPQFPPEIPNGSLHMETFICSFICAHNLQSSKKQNVNKEHQPAAAVVVVVVRARPAGRLCGCHVVGTPRGRHVGPLGLAACCAGRLGPATASPGPSLGLQHMAACTVKAKTDCHVRLRIESKPYEGKTKKKNKN